MSDLFGNSEDRFSYDIVHICTELNLSGEPCKPFSERAVFKISNPVWLKPAKVKGLATGFAYLLLFEC